MPVLLRPEDVAGAADLQVPQGNAEARAELGEFPDGAEPLLGGLGENLVLPDGEVGVGLLGGTADPAPQLVELAQAEAVRVEDDQGVGGGDVQTALDDGGARRMS